MPRSETIPYQDYQQGYQPRAQETQAQNAEDEYEKPKASYPQQLPEQKNG